MRRREATRQPTKYAEAAEPRVLEVWACRGCGGLFHMGAEGELAARACCADDRPCSTEGCKGTCDRPYIACRACRDERDRARWQERLANAVPWDKESPVYSEVTQKYYTDGEVWSAEGDDLATLEEMEELRLVVCERTQPREFCLGEWLSDDLPDDGDGHLPDEARGRAAEEALNAYLRETFFSWTATAIPVDPRTLL